MITSLEAFNNLLYAGTLNWVKWRTGLAIGQWFRLDRSKQSWFWQRLSGFLTQQFRPGRVQRLTVLRRNRLGKLCWYRWWRSPDGTNWEQVIGDGFGNPANHGITTFTVFSDTLYAATVTGSTGVEIWRSSTGETWTRPGQRWLGLPHQQRDY